MAPDRPPTLTAVEGWRPFAWAGLMLWAPESFVPARISGNAQNGSISLADADRPRLEIVWGKVTRTRFDPARAAQKRLLKSAAVDKSAVSPAQIQSVPNPAFGPLLFLPGTTGPDRCCGYATETGRMIELAYHRADSAEDLLFRKAMLASLRDQTPTHPTRWAFFGLSFQSPTEFTYREARLNIGDMRVELTNKDHLGRWQLFIRHIHPATLALKRQPMEHWLDQLAREDPLYSPQTTGRWRERKLDWRTVQTPIGPGVAVIGQLKIQHRIVRPLRPKWMHLNLLHHEPTNRLVSIKSYGPTPDIDELLKSIYANYNWASA